MVTDKQRRVSFIGMSQVLLELLAQVDHQESKDRLAQVAPRDCREALDFKEQRASWELLVLPVCLETQEQLVRNR
jgi:hypothetical protein